MTKERIRAPKRIKGTRDVVVKVHALGLVHSKFSSQRKKFEKKKRTWMNDAKPVPSVTTQIWIRCHMPVSRPRLCSLIPKALGTYALFLRPVHYASALYCQSCKAPQCLLSTDASSTRGPLTKLTWTQQTDLLCVNHVIRCFVLPNIRT